MLPNRGWEEEILGVTPGTAMSSGQNEDREDCQELGSPGAEVGVIPLYEEHPSGLIGGAAGG